MPGRKHTQFVGELVGFKLVTKLPGVGIRTGERLGQLNQPIVYAQDLCAMYYNNHGDDDDDTWKEKISDTLRECQANRRQIDLTINAINAYCNRYEQNDDPLPPHDDQEIQRFANLPIDDRGIDAIPGMNPQLQANLREHGIDRAYQLLFMFYALRRNELLFLGEMQELYAATPDASQAMYLAMSRYDANPDNTSVQIPQNGNQIVAAPPHLSLKHTDFVSNGMNDTTVKNLPGIGNTYGNTMGAKNIRWVSQLHFLYHAFKNDSVLFTKEVLRRFGCLDRYAGQTAYAMQALCHSAHHEGTFLTCKVHKYVDKAQQ